MFRHSRARAIRTYGPDAILRKEYDKRHNFYNEPDTRIFSEKLVKYWDQDLQIRAEWETLSIFCKNEKLFYEIELDLARWLYEVHQPGTREELDFLLGQTRRKIVCNELPHGKYRYRVKLKSTMDVNARQSFITWIKQYGDKVSISTHTEMWFGCSNSGYGWNPFLLVEDSAMLTMASLFLGGNARFVEEFVPRSSINIILEQDSTCQHSQSPLNLQTT